MDNAGLWGKAFRIFTGEELDFGDFDHRLAFQKIVYLLQKSGLDPSINFLYNWYLRGPYCPDVARMGADYFFRGMREYELDEGQIAKIREAREILGITPDLDFYEISRRVELLASALYTLDNETRVRGEICDKLYRTKPWFSREDIRDAVDKIRHFVPNG